jgi:hypothetical protein
LDITPDDRIRTTSLKLIETKKDEEYRKNSRGWRRNALKTK